MEDGSYTSYFMTEGKANGSGKPKGGFFGLLWKFARIGDRLSPYVAAACVVAAVHLILFK